MRFPPLRAPNAARAARCLAAAMLVGCDEVPAARHQPQEQTERACGVGAFALDPPPFWFGVPFSLSPYPVRVAVDDGGDVLVAGTGHYDDGSPVAVIRARADVGIVPARRRKAGDAGKVLLLAREDDGSFRLLIRRPAVAGGSELLQARLGPDCEESRWLPIRASIDGDEVAAAEPIGADTLLLVRDGLARRLVAVDPIFGRVQLEVPVGDSRDALAIGADGTIALYSPASWDGSVEVRDGSTFALLHTLPAPDVGVLRFVVARADGGYLLGASIDDGDLIRANLRIHDGAGALIHVADLDQPAYLGAQDGTGYALVLGSSGPGAFELVRLSATLGRGGSSSFGTVGQLDQDEDPIALALTPDGQAVVLLEWQPFEYCCGGQSLTFIRR